MAPRTLLLTLAAALTLAACASGPSEPGPAAPASTTTPTTEASGSLAVSWTGTGAVDLPNGWTVRDCDGDRPQVCIYDEGTFLGDVELLAGFPLAPEEESGEPGAVAIQWAQRMVDDFRADRAQGCAAFRFEPLEVVGARVGGRPGARGGFTLTDGEGRVVEHVVNHYVVVDGQMTIVNTDAYATSGGCLPPADDSPSFTPDDLAALDRGILDRIVADSPATA